MHTRCLGIAAIVFVLAADRCWAQADDAEKEVTKQTTRQISSAIVGRVTATEGSAPGAVAVWSTTSYNWISIRNGSSSGFGVTPGAVAPPDFSVRLFQQIIGADTRVGPFVLGLSGAFSHTGGDQAGFATPPGFSTGSTDLTGHSFSVSPYAAFVLDQYFFFTGLVGYTRGTSSVTTGASMFSFPGLPPTTFPGSDIDSNADTFFTDVAGNVVYPIPDTPITLGGRAGYRYQVQLGASGQHSQHRFREQHVLRGGRRALQHRRLGTLCSRPVPNITSHLAVPSAILTLSSCWPGLITTSPRRSPPACTT